MLSACVSFFFFNDSATTEIYPLSLHDAFPILASPDTACSISCAVCEANASPPSATTAALLSLPTFDRPMSATSAAARSEEHTSELQSPCNLVSRLLLEKKKKYEPCSSPTGAHH